MTPTPSVSSCYGRGMSEQADESAIAQRAELLPEEQAAGSDDAEAQAEAILEESDERTGAPRRPAGSPQTPD